MRKILIFFECLNFIVGAGSPVPELEDQSKECGLDNLEFHDQDTEAPKESLCVLCLCGLILNFPVYCIHDLKYN